MIFMADAHFSKDELLSASTFYYSKLWKVRLQDVDAAGIVFFARIFEACHDVYIDFLQAQGSWFSENLRSLKIFSPMIHAEADFLKPLRFLDEVEVRIVKIHVTDRKYMFGYRLVKKENQEVIAIAQTFHVFVDPTRFERIPMPMEAREQLEKIIQVNERHALDRRK